MDTIRLIEKIFQLKKIFFEAIKLLKLYLLGLVKFSIQRMTSLLINCSHVIINDAHIILLSQKLCYFDYRLF